MFRSQFTAHDARSYGLDFAGEVPKTVQYEKDLCDINLIMRKYHKTGDISLLNRREGVFADVYDAPDYMEAHRRVTAVNELFASLPAVVRDRFGNSPSNFLAFSSDPANVSELVAMGLLDAVKQPSSVVEEGSEASVSE